jgi:hypothetical protein
MPCAKASSSRNALFPPGAGNPMSARHRVEDVDQVSLIDLLDTDEHSPRTVLVELSYSTPRGERRITVRRLSGTEGSS